MSDTTTIARPYAKAIFKHALSAGRLAEWSQVLCDLANVVLHPKAQQFICNPTTTPAVQTEFLLGLKTSGEQTSNHEAIKNLVGLLAENKRLLVLPDVFVQYEALRAEQEKTLIACVSSFAALTSTEENQLIHSLSQRLQRQVTLDVSIDPSLIGGAVIRAGDLVIDGSVRGKLNKLSTTLAA